MSGTKLTPVQVCMITYNHEPYIRQAIESILMQKTNFDFSLIIGEDFSTDNTRSICIEIARENPGRVILLENEKNLGMMPNFIRTLQSAKSELVAFCEGDDYWIDENKLQRQYELMVQNPDTPMCCHAHYEEYNQQRKLFQAEVTSDGFVSNDFIFTVGGGFAATNSFFFKRSLLDTLPAWFYEAPTGDFPVTLLALAKGNIRYQKEPMSVYRAFVPQGWSTSQKSFAWYDAYFQREAAYLEKFNQWTDQRFAHHIAHFNKIRMYRLVYRYFQFNKSPVKRMRYLLGKLFQLGPSLAMKAMVRIVFLPNSNPNAA